MSEPAQKTVQTAQPFFEVAEDGGRWRWGLWSSEKELVAVSSEGYKSIQDCKQAIGRMLATASVKRIVVMQTQ